MDKKRLVLLERAFDAEVSCALGGSKFHFMQTKSALAETMVEEGLLQKIKASCRGATIEGYALTHKVRYAYCESCSDIQDGGSWVI